MSTIRVELSDWLYNAGIVGMVNILEYNDIEVVKEVNYIEFDMSALEAFEEKYFKYFIEKYKPFTSWYKIVSFEDYILDFNKDELDENGLKFINNKMKYMKRILNSASYKSGYKIIDDKFDILKERKNLKKISKRKKESIDEIIDEVNNQLKIMKKIIKHLKKDKVKRVILAKNVIYDVIAKFWSNVSFLHRNSSKKDMYKEYSDYFVKYIADYSAEDKQSYKYQCFSCDRPIAKLSKPASYDLTWLNSIGVDMSRKTSHFWDFNASAYICPICNLVYSCVPAGVTVLKSRGLFINQNSHTDILIRINSMSLSHNKRFEELEEETYYSIAENLEQSNIEHTDKEINNIQIVKVDSNNTTRPYTFNVLSRDKLRIIYQYRKQFKFLINKHIKVTKNYYMNLYSEVLRRLYNNQNQFDLIHKLFKFKLDDKFNNLFYVEQIIKINNSYLGGIMKSKYIYYKKVNAYKEYGLKLRKAYIEKGSNNKLGGITYRLLNALKTKDTAKFMDTLINSYLYLKKTIPTDFVDALQDVDRFQTIGYAFVLGLQGGRNKDSKSKEKNSKEGDIIDE